MANGRVARRHRHGRLGVLARGCDTGIGSGHGVMGACIGLGLGLGDLRVQLDACVLCYRIGASPGPASALS